ncbi:MAG: hypothetical protein FWG28_08615, partial [Clostridiales bacterium]|nr:hypothetical protein [Clostridiales bacterium]
MAKGSNFIVRGGADFSGIKKEMEKARAGLAKFQKDVQGSMAGFGGALKKVAVLMNMTMVVDMNGLKLPINMRVSVELEITAIGD